MKRIAAILCVALSARAESGALTPAASAYADAAGEALRSPEGLACTAEGYVVAADSGNGRLVSWSFKEGALAGGTAIKFPELGYPARLQIDSKGNVLSLDRRTRRIARTGERGGFGGFLDIKGVPPAAGFFPVAFKLDRADGVYLLDVTSARVVVLDASGAFVRQIALPAGASFTDIAVDARGAVLGIDGPGASLWAAAPGAAAFTPVGKPMRDFLSFPTYLAIGPQGLLTVVDGHGNGLVTLAPDGQYLGRRLSIGWSDGLVYYPGQICIDAQGDTFIADRGNNRVQAFTAAK